MTCMTLSRVVLIFSLLLAVGCGSPQSSACTQTDTATKRQALKVVQVALENSYGGDGSNFSFDVFALRNDIIILRCGEIVVVRTAPKSDFHGGAVTGPEYEFRVNLEANKLM